MPSPNETLTEINRIISGLVEVGLVDDQNFAIQKQVRTLTEVTFQGASEVGFGLKGSEYQATYRHFTAKRTYNVKMLDGGLVQIMYAFLRDSLQRHRLGFFPALEREEFEDTSDDLEDVYREWSALHTVRFPIRFDYDISDSKHVVKDHPKSHLTLGDFAECRIPATSPLTPSQFFDFILRNFYYRAFQKYCPTITEGGGVFAEDIHGEERRVIHISVPRS